MIEIYTDGACTGNPGEGAWGFIVIKDGVVIQKSKKAYKLTTNNRMEMLAVFFALKYIFDSNLLEEEIIIYSDSNLVVSAFNQNWLQSWKKNNWRKSDKKAVVNKDIWEYIGPLYEKIRPKFVWVKGHNGNKYNEEVDKLATGEVEQARISDNFFIDKNYEIEKEK